MSAHHYPFAFPCQILDLSVPLADQSPGEPLPPSIRYLDHANEGLAQMTGFFGIQPSDLAWSQGQGWAVEEVHAITHTGTHVDAPYHYAATSEGKPARTIDELPLDWFLAPGVRLDVRDVPAGDEITPNRLQQELDRISHRLSPGEIVLLWTDADKRLGQPSYFEQPGLGRDGVLWLADQGVRVIGIDAYTLDRPFRSMREDFERTGDGRWIWPAHFAGIVREYCQIEKLARLDELPGPTGYWISCLPVKIARASAGWCRAVALIPPPPP